MGAHPPDAQAALVLLLGPASLYSLSAWDIVICNLNRVRACVSVIRRKMDAHTEVYMCCHRIKCRPHSRTLKSPPRAPLFDTMRHDHVTFEGRKLLPRGGLPDLDQLVVTGGNDVLPIRREGARQHEPMVAL